MRARHVADLGQLSAAAHDENAAISLRDCGALVGDISGRHDLRMHAAALRCFQDDLLGRRGAAVGRAVAYRD